MIEHFSTRNVPGADKLPYWRSLMSSTYSGLSTNPLTPHFEATVSRWQMGGIAMTRPRATPVSVERRLLEAGHGGGPRLKLHVVRSGQGRAVHRRRELDVRAGDMVLCASEEVYRFDLRSEHELVVAEFDRAVLGEAPHWLDDAVATCIPREAPSTRLLHDFMLSLWRESEASPDGLPDEGYDAVFCSLLLASLRPTDQVARPSRHGLLERARAIVAARLADHTLSPATIAADMGVSLRRLQAAAAGQGVTLGGYINERRLALAAQKLTLEPQSSITQIAFDCGFSDSSYFSRRFQERFGQTPRQYRAMH
ncbi:helix-turn-helix domain-containing protein [Novosphingobium sp. SG720]|uniref:helix-turn-helix domain-containing protein n=1 Tax=Novosphingobium sp. SG720 TaxID=2586998 RepID=UPI001446D0AD|nr:helix-turn-helix domain-containing protein [Novosphingobium sp. SG720]NKJ43962.1 AraC-like DNA-binding protein [Novosphingobium sp. SG720]